MLKNADKTSSPFPLRDNPSGETKIQFYLYQFPDGKWIKMQEEEVDYLFNLKTLEGWVLKRKLGKSFRGPVQKSDYLSYGMEHDKPSTLRVFIGSESAEEETRFETGGTYLGRIEGKKRKVKFFPPS